ncbi:MAG: DEAD/DEAH box helicase, partial [Dehalococcoidia bacterium]
MDAAAFLHHLVSLPDYRQQVVHIERIHPQAALTGKLDNPLHSALQTCLEFLGISALYSHQAKALNAILAGKNVIIATPSASGKTLCYHLATLDALLHNKDSRALYIFPTKALAQDQLRSLKQILGETKELSQLLSPGAVATFDGDTPQNERANIRKRANIVLTNPDMLHLGILPNHQSWSRLFRNLKYVVIDETHIYRGVFGSHVANVLRRLRRLCSAYGSSPQFICCSATIANPEEHAQNIVGLPFESIVEDGSPHGEKYFTFWNPPIIDEAKTGRRSSNSEAAFLLGELVQKEIRSLVFARTRKL